MLHSRSTPSPSASMQQYLLELAAPAEPNLANFVAGGNAEIYAALFDALQKKSRESIYIWGEAASGKTHLLRAGASAAAPHGFSPCYVDCSEERDLAIEPSQDWLSVDNVETLSEQGQIRLFDFYNALRERNGVFIAAGSAAPSQLILRDDLSSRLGWGLVFQIKRLDDAEKRAALVAHAGQRGFALKPELVDFMLNRWPRDLPSLVKVIDSLDRYSMEHKRPIGIELLREMLRFSPPA